MKKCAPKTEAKDRITLIKEALQAKKAKISALPKRAAPKAPVERNDVQDGRGIRQDWTAREGFYKEVREWGSMYDHDSPRRVSGSSDVMRELKEFGY